LEWLIVRRILVYLRTPGMAGKVAKRTSIKSFYPMADPGGFSAQTVTRLYRSVVSARTKRKMKVL